MYFDKEKLKINMNNVGRIGRDGSKKSKEDSTDADWRLTVHPAWRIQAK